MERWGETDLLVGKREKENVIMNGEREKNQALLLCFLFSSRRGRCGRKKWEGHGDREKMRESETKPQEYGTSYHLVELYSTVLSH